ncbi:MAG: Xylulose kinase [Enterocloster aldenensis]|nr:FGGY family carbohydrate kinase [uncultured Lachnoclostridium sp.]
MKNVLIGIDVGTSGTKAAVVDTDGKILGEALVGYPVICLENGWAEQDALLWEQAVYQASGQAVKQAAVLAGVRPGDVAGICVSGLFAGSGVPLDETMKPLRNAIIWMDRRAVLQCRNTRTLVSDEELFSITGNRNDAYFGFNKILWIRDNEPDIWEKIRWLLSSNGYIVYCLTGEISMDHTAAANIGGIYDLDKGRWSYPTMERLGIRESLFPEHLMEPQDIAGYLTEEAAMKMGLVPGIPVCAGCTDCLASMISAGVFEENVQTAVIGTSINWGILHRDFPTDSRLVTMPHAIAPKILKYTYGGISSAGVLCKWFLEQVAPFTRRPGTVVETDFQILEKEAGRIPPGSGGLLVLPYFMGERSPIWDSGARGVFCGLSMKHTRAHMYRAVLEALSYACRQIRETSPVFALSGDTCIVSGGACCSGLWMQILADVTGLRIITTDDSVQAPAGDALIAGVSIGVIPSYEEGRKWARHKEVYEPDWDRFWIYDKYYKEYLRLYDATSGIVHSLADM